MKFYKTYPDAPGATLISFLSAVVLAMGIVAAAGSVIAGIQQGMTGFALTATIIGVIAGVVLVGVGLLMRKLAEKQAEKTWKTKGLK